MGIVPPPVSPPGLPAAYLAQSSGAATGSGSTISVPDQVAVINGHNLPIAAQALTVPLPSAGRTLVSATAGVVTFPNLITYFGKIEFTVTNNSGATIAAQTITLDGADERQTGPSSPYDTISIPSLTNGTSAVVVTNKYFGLASGAGAIVVTLPAALQAAGVTITGTEYQFRGNLKLNASGVQFAWNNDYVTGETKLCQFEVSRTGISYVRDFRFMGPVPKAQRVGTEVVDWCSSTPEGPSRTQWAGNCVYVACETLDGHLIIAGNSARFAEWDGQQFVKFWERPNGLTLSDHVTAMCNMGLNSQGHEIIFFGTATGKCGRWDRTADTYSTPTGSGFSSSYAINRMVKGFNVNTVVAVTNTSTVVLITDSGSAASTNNYASVGPNALNAAGNDTMLDAAWVDRHLYLVGGGGTGFRFWHYNYDLNHSFELTPYLPGPQAALGKTGGAASAVLASLCATSDGRLIIVGSSQLGGFYLAEWDTKQVFAKGRLQFTTTAAQTIPAGTVVSNGTIQFETLEPIVATGAGTFTAPGRALSGGAAGFAAYNTITTLVTTGLTNVSAVTNSTPFGFGRYVGGTTADEMLLGLGSNIPLHVSWTGRRAIVLTQAGDVVNWDGSRLFDITRLFSFKGRATFGFKHSRCHFVVGDEGKVFSLPH